MERVASRPGTAELPLRRRAWRAPTTSSYYASVSGYGDEMLWAALWLHRATGKASYLDYAVDMADEFGGTTWAITEFSWDVKYAGLQILATKVLLEGKHPENKATLEKYKAKAEHYLCACLNKNGDAGNVNRTAGGMLFVRQWNNMQYVTNAAFLLTVYSRYLTSAGQDPPVLQCPDGPAHADELRALARAQADYVLGANPAGVSYLVGYGPRFPRRMHHRGASIVSHRGDGRFVGCMQGYDNWLWFLRRGANPNVVVGAIVGGPDHLDRFRDSRDNYMQTEACTYNTAPMVGIFAHLHSETAITEKS